MQLTLLPFSFLKGILQDARLRALKTFAFKTERSSSSHMNLIVNLIGCVIVGQTRGGSTGIKIHTTIQLWEMMRLIVLQVNMTEKVSLF